MSLAVLVPVLNRPHRVEPTLQGFLSTAPGCRVLFLADRGDVAELNALRTAGADFIAPGGNYAAKINAGARLTDEPLLLLGADDLKPHEGWLEAALAKMTDGIGVVGINDLCNPRTATGGLATHSLVSREYAERGTVDEPDKLLHEGYRHEWVDLEFTETAKSRGAFAHAPDSIVEHLHPDVGKAPMDDLYAGRPPRMRQGRRLYQQRRHLWA